MAQRPLVVMVLTAALLPLLFLGVAGHNATCRECQEQPRSKLLDTWLIKTIDLEDAFKGLQVQVLVTCESGERAMVLAGRSRDELFSSAATEVLGCSWEIDPNGIHVCYLPAPLESSEKLHYGLQATYRGQDTPSCTVKTTWHYGRAPLLSLYRTQLAQNAVEGFWLAGVFVAWRPFKLLVGAMLAIYSPAVIPVLLLLRGPARLLRLEGRSATVYTLLSGALSCWIARLFTGGLFTCYDAVLHAMQLDPGYVLPQPWRAMLIFAAGGLGAGFMSCLSSASSRDCAVMGAKALHLGMLFDSALGGSITTVITLVLVLNDLFLPNQVGPARRR